MDARTFLCRYDKEIAKMKSRLLMGCSAALLVIAAGCGQTVNYDAEVRALKDNEIQWNKDFVAKDVDKLMAHYADDAVLMAPGMPAVSGREAIRATLKEMVGDNALSLKFESSHVDVDKSGEMGFTQGSYTMTVTDPATKKPINDKGSYVTVYKKINGSWKAESDIATSATPPGAPAANPQTASK
jgi:ketosteroid isomerase-like protein